MKKILESFETPNQKKMWIDHVTTIHDATKTDTKIDNIDLKDLTQFDFKLDIQTNTVSFTEDPYEVCGQYDAGYEDLFFHVTIKKIDTKEIIYKINYGQEFHNNNEIEDTQVEAFLDKLVSIAIDQDPQLKENFEVIEESYVIDQLKKNQKKITIEFDDDDLEISKDEAQEILDYYNKLSPFHKKKFEKELEKSRESFLLAYNDSINESNQLDEAYMNQEKKKKIEPKVKEILKKYKLKGSLSVNNRSTLVLNIKSGEVDFFGDAIKEKWKKSTLERGYMGINHYYYKDHFKGTSLKFIEEIYVAMNDGNHDNSDVQSDYFDVGWYVDINVGDYSKPYVYTGK